MTRRKQISKARVKTHGKLSKGSPAKKQTAEIISAHSLTIRDDLRDALEPVTEEVVLDHHHHCLQDTSVRCLECLKFSQEAPLTTALKLDVFQHKTSSKVQGLQIAEQQCQRKDMVEKCADASSMNTTDKSEKHMPVEPIQTAEVQSTKDGFDLAVRGLEATDSIALTWEKEDVVSYPLTSTMKQKEVRRLARQRKILEMKHRQLAEDRQMRLLRRQGLVMIQREKGRKRVTWQKDSELVKMFFYSP